MTTAVDPTAAESVEPSSGRIRRSPFAWAISDSMAIAGRNLIKLRRSPQMLVFATVQPVIFVLLFRYVFGGAIAVKGIDYVDYLMPGIFVQTITFGAMNTGVGLSEDLHTGLIERFRSLPMARSAVLAGRTGADLVRNVFVVFLMVVIGYLVGFRVSTNIVQFLVGIAVLLLFAFALSWVFANVGLIAPNAETAQAMSFPVLAPLVFASSAFVPVDSMPGWLQGFATHQPVSVTVSAARALMTGYGETGSNLVQSVAWSLVMIAIFAPLAVRRYRQTA